MKTRIYAAPAVKYHMVRCPVFAGQAQIAWSQTMNNITIQAPPLHNLNKTSLTKIGYNIINPF